MQHRSHITVLAGLMGLVLAGATSFASAQPANDGSDLPTMRVSYHDLNINEPAGAKALLGRIHHAASVLCEDFRYDDPPFGARGYARCVRKAVGRAVAGLNNPAVTALADPQPVRTATLAARDR